MAPRRHHCPWSTRPAGRPRSVTPPPADVGARAPWALHRHRLPRPWSAPPRQRHRRRQRRPPLQWWLHHLRPAWRGGRPRMAPVEQVGPCLRRHPRCRRHRLHRRPPPAAPAVVPVVGAWTAARRGHPMATAACHRLAAARGVSACRPRHAGVGNRQRQVAARHFTSPWLTGMGSGGGTLRSCAC